MKSGKGLKSAGSAFVVFEKAIDTSKILLKA